MGPRGLTTGQFVTTSHLEPYRYGPLDSCLSIGRFSLHFYRSRPKEIGEKCEGCAKEIMLSSAGAIDNNLMSHRNVELKGNL